MTENELSDVICQLVSIAEDSVDRETFEELDNAGVEIINCLEELQSLREKAEPKKPIIIHEQVCDGVAEIEWECPVCGRKCIDIAPCPEWCSGCGTKFDWS